MKRAYLQEVRGQEGLRLSQSHLRPRDETQKEAWIEHLAHLEREISRREAVLTQEARDTEGLR